VRISIITATFNSQHTIADTMNSIGMQAYPDVEHIIVDGCSTDNTLAIVSNFSHNYKLVSEEDKGLYDAMNKGISMASGEVVGILNGDDFYTKSDVLSKVADLFMNPAVMCVYADLDYVDKNDISKVVRRWRAGAYSSQKFFYGWMPPHPTFFVRRNLYEKYGQFDLRFKSAADYELMLRFLVKHELQATYLPDVIVKMRTGGQSNVSIRNRWRANREDRRAWDVNGLTPYFFTIPLKPLRKLIQFLV